MLDMDFIVDLRIGQAFDVVAMLRHIPHKPVPQSADFVLFRPFSADLKRIAEKAEPDKQHSGLFKDSSWFHSNERGNRTLIGLMRLINTDKN
jgi:hypothetical protein